MIFRAKPVSLDPASAQTREPPRPPEARQPDYEEKFDRTTLFYDAVYTAKTASLRLIGPPLLNLADAFQSAKFRDPAGVVLAHERTPALDKLEEIIVRRVGRDTPYVTLSFGGADYPIQIRRDPDLSLFAGRKVLLAISKNNDLDWIADWAEFYAAVHGFDGLLLFDNGSTLYSVETLEERLRAVPGYERVCVVDWSVKWGPHRGPNRVWDSNFGQTGALATARRRFLDSAALVLQVDIDELVVQIGNRSLLKTCQSSPYGAITFVGLWTVGLEGQMPPVGDGARRHRDYLHHLWSEEHLRRARISTKWAVAPQKARKVIQWRNHFVTGLPLRRLLTDEFEFRHFREITTNWKGVGRNKRVRSSENNVFYDAKLADCFTRLNWLKPEDVRAPGDGQVPPERISRS